ncbi:MAG: bifunctional ornithine acetyltransferase/N-acetylglutamate synthase, partial [Phenylobacterium sp.]
MTKKPAAPNKAAKSTAEKALEAAAKPVEALAGALDPLATAIKRATKKSEPAAKAEEPKPVKGALPVSPLAVPLPKMPPIPGVQLATGRAGFYKYEREDLLVMRFAKGTAGAGVFTRHGIGSAPVDWCKKHLEMTKGADVRALVVNAGCANSFTGKPGADAVRRVASAVAKRFDCRQRDVMVASTGVIGVLLDDAKITHRLPDVEAKLTDDGWPGAARAIMTTDTYPKGAYAEAMIDGEKVRIGGIAKGSGMIAPDMATMLAFAATDAKIPREVLQSLLVKAADRSFNAIT